MQPTDSGFASTSYFEEVKQLREKAEAEVIALANGSRKWTMCIPVQDDDSDQVLMNALRQLKELAIAHEKLSSDMIKTLKILDRAGIWTGADDLVYDRIGLLVDEYRVYKARAEGYRQVAEQRGKAIMPFVREFDKQIEEVAESDPDTAMEMFQYNLTIGDVYNLLLSVKGDRELWNDAT